MKSRILCWLLLLFWSISLAGCALCIGGAIGGVAGYEGHKRGYRLQSPVKQNPQGYLDFKSPVTKARGQ